MKVIVVVVIVVVVVVGVFSKLSKAQAPSVLSLSLNSQPF